MSWSCLNTTSQALWCRRVPLLHRLLKKHQTKRGEPLWCSTDIKSLVRKSLFNRVIMKIPYHLGTTKSLVMISRTISPINFFKGYVLLMYSRGNKCSTRSFPKNAAYGIPLSSENNKEMRWPPWTNLMQGEGMAISSTDRLTSYIVQASLKRELTLQFKKEWHTCIVKKLINITKAKHNNIVCHSDSVCSLWSEWIIAIIYKKRSPLT